jgi:hypothetical protein
LFGGRDFRLGRRLLLLTQTLIRAVPRNTLRTRVALLLLLVVRTRELHVQEGTPRSRRRPRRPRNPGVLRIIHSVRLDFLFDPDSILRSRYFLFDDLAISLRRALAMLLAVAPGEVLLVTVFTVSISIAVSFCVGSGALTPWSSGAMTSTDWWGDSPSPAPAARAARSTTLDSSSAPRET